MFTYTTYAKHDMCKKNFYGWDEKTYWMSIHGQSSAVGESGIVREPPNSPR